MHFSIIVPTFSRPDEVSELLTSLVNQKYKDFELIIADGSMDESVKHVVGKYFGILEIKYLYKKGLGISESRNWGVDNARGDYVVFFDSDCLIPPQYFEVVSEFLKLDPLDAFGGPDQASDSFSYQQKAISYAMTSFFTTGGIRGRKMHVGQYQPRSFNMGIRRSVFSDLGGFSGLRVSEDIDLSIRLNKKGLRSGLIEEAYVFHKRRSSFYKFFRQVFSFGSGRIDLQLRHGDALKPVHMMPSVFVLYLLGGFVSGAISNRLFLLWGCSALVYIIALMIDASLKNKSLLIGIISVYASFVMLIGYGLGMMKAVIVRMILKNKKESEKPAITKES